MDADEESEKGKTMSRRKRSGNAPGMQVRLHLLIHHHHTRYLTNHATVPSTHTRAIIHYANDVRTRGNEDPEVPRIQVRPAVLSPPYPHLLSTYHKSTPIQHHHPTTDDVDGARPMSRGTHDDTIDTIDRPSTPSTPRHPPHYNATTGC
jgi:hypothetical protein